MTLFMAVKHFPEATHPKICLFSLLLHTHTHTHTQQKGHHSQRKCLKSITMTGFSLTDFMSGKKQDLSLNFTSYLSVFTPRVKGELTGRIKVQN